MEQISLQPDIICNSQRKRTMHHSRRSASDVNISIHSRRDHGTDAHMNHTYGRFHHLRHNSSNACLHDNKTDGSNYFTKRNQHVYDIRDARGTYVSDHRTVRTSESDRSRLLYIENSIPRELFDVNRPPGSSQTSSRSLHSSQRLSEPSSHRQARTYQGSLYRHRSSCHELSRQAVGNGREPAAATENAQTPRISEQCDPEVLKEIVRTLRFVGDDLDIKMRKYNEPFHKAVLDALRANTGQLLLATVKQFNLVGVAMEASLSLLKLLSQ